MPNSHVMSPTPPFWGCWDFPLTESTGVSGFLPPSTSLRAVPQVESEMAAQTAFSSDNCAVSFGEMGGRAPPCFTWISHSRCSLRVRVVLFLIRPSCNHHWWSLVWQEMCHVATWSGPPQRHVESALGPWPRGRRGRSLHPGPRSSGRWAWRSSRGASLQEGRGTDTSPGLLFLFHFFSLRLESSLCVNYR